MSDSYGIITVGHEISQDIMPGPQKSPRAAALQRHAQRYQRLLQELQSLEYFCKGTVLERRMKCGQPSCGCHENPAKRHGPYWEWTYKAQAKTVNVRLVPAAGPIYKAASQQYRKLKALLTQLERLSRTALAAVAKNAESTHPPVRRL
jgi:hypothetical protein